MIGIFLVVTLLAFIIAIPSIVLVAILYIFNATFRKWMDKKWTKS